MLEPERTRRKAAALKAAALQCYEKED